LSAVSHRSVNKFPLPNINGLLHTALLDRLFDGSHHSLADDQHEHASRGHYDHRPDSHVSRLQDWQRISRHQVNTQDKIIVM